MTSYIEAQFVGDNECGFQEGHAYQLLVEQRRKGRLIVTATHGYRFKPIADTQHTYDSLGAFLSNWKVIRVVSPSGEPE